VRPAERVAALAATAGLIGALGGCGDDGPDRVTATGVVAVESLDNTFRADRVEVAPGTEVRFTNVGRNDHDINPSAGVGWGVGKEAFGPGATYSEVFTTPGEYPYYCTLHGTPTAGMTGVIVVAD
jgi:plastocyanin